MTKPLLLLVEDDVMLGEVYCTVLERPELDIEWIKNGTDAEIRLREIVPMLILLDLHLPGVSGITLLKQIRADERLARTQVAVVTADALRAREVENLANIVLIKPVRMGDLERLVIQYVLMKK
jgi:two-component system response regulator AdeR